MSGVQVKTSIVQAYISLNAQRYLATGQVKLKLCLSAGQVNISRFFYPCLSIVSGCFLYDYFFMTYASIRMKIMLVRR